MTKRMIKFRAFHFYVEVPALGLPGENTLVERTAFLGQEVDIPREEDIDRGEGLGAFYTSAEVKKIKDGTYDGPDRDMLAMPPMGEPMAIPPLNPAEAAASASPLGAGEPTATPERPELDIAEASSEMIGAYIKEYKLTGPETVALAGDNPELAEKILEAEGIATDNSPRKNVTEPLEELGAKAQAPA